MKHREAEQRLTLLNGKSWFRKPRRFRGRKL